MREVKVAISGVSLFSLETQHNMMKKMINKEKSS